MKIVLTKDVPKIGQKGETKEVSDGFARNFLLAKNLAVRADDPKVKEILLDKKAHENQERLKHKEEEKKIAGLNGQKFVFRVKTDKNGHLYGSIGPKELSERTGLNEHIFKTHFKQIGNYPVEIEVPGNLRAKIEIVIEKEDNIIK